MTTPASPRPHWQGYAETVLRVVSTPWPYGSAHASRGPDDVDVTPERLHPAFHGSLDWHSSAHMQWSAVRLLAEHRDALTSDTAAALSRLLDERLTASHGVVEAAYLRERPGFERPYGWGWAAMLAAATIGTPWYLGLEPLQDVIADHLLAWLPALAYPVRHGVHANTAFGLGLAHRAYTTIGRADVVALIELRARDWFGADRDYPSRWEPSGEDFLSPALCEADLMRRVLPPAELEPWLAGFLPRLAADGDPLLDVPRVLDRTDGKAVHLFGLALSRAWQLRLLAPHLPPDRADRIARATDAQVAAVETEIVSGDFMATHWLVSFALLAADGV